jgi:ubiquinone/menaquinone biosynthesis C-methylase UbiE
MSTQLHQIPSEYFDLAFCEHVLYFMQDDVEVLQRAVNQMTRVVRPGGWIVAIEEQPEISQMFSTAGQILVTCPQAPPSAYCFKKPVV